MRGIQYRSIVGVKKLLVLLLFLELTACTAQVNESPVDGETETSVTPIQLPANTTFPQIHAHLSGMVREFVRTMYQDSKGNYWFGTNGDGIIRFDGDTLEKVDIELSSERIRVFEILEDRDQNLWFASSIGLVKYDGHDFTPFSLGRNSSGLDTEVWSIAIGKDGLFWVGSTRGVFQFDGEEFHAFDLPQSEVKDATPMLNEKLVFKILVDEKGAVWFVTDGHGLFKYAQGKFIQFTTQNGLADNHTADILEDGEGNIWLGSFFGGVSLYDGSSFTHFTEKGVVQGDEIYNLFEDEKGNVWFSAEGYGVYRYDGSEFTQFTVEDGLTTQVVQNIYEDQQNNLWFATWQGLCIFDGKAFVNASAILPWTH